MKSIKKTYHIYRSLSIHYIRKNNLSLDLIPEIDIDLYNYLFKRQVQNNIITGNEKFDILKQIIKYNTTKKLKLSRDNVHL